MTNHQEYTYLKNLVRLLSYRSSTFKSIRVLLSIELWIPFSVAKKYSKHSYHPNNRKVAPLLTFDLSNGPRVLRRRKIGCHSCASIISFHFQSESVPYYPHSILCVMLSHSIYEAFAFWAIKLNILY